MIRNLPPNELGTGKTDQYATRDKKLDTKGVLKALHAELYKDGDHPGNVFYVFVCRVVLGESLETRTGSDSCFATRHRRELVQIPGTNPSVLHHALIGRVCNHSHVASGRCPHGCCLRPDRFNEFVSFHATRTYPEYLIAYHRE